MDISSAFLVSCSLQAMASPSRREVSARWVGAIRHGALLGCCLCPLVAAQTRQPLDCASRWAGNPSVVSARRGDALRRGALVGCCLRPLAAVQTRQPLDRDFALGWAGNPRAVSARPGRPTRYGALLGWCLVPVGRRADTATARLRFALGWESKRGERSPGRRPSTWRTRWVLPAPVGRRADPATARPRLRAGLGWESTRRERSPGAAHSIWRTPWVVPGARWSPRRHGIRSTATSRGAGASRDAYAVRREANARWTRDLRSGRAERLRATSATITTYSIRPSSGDDALA